MCSVMTLRYQNVHRACQSLPSTRGGISFKTSIGAPTWRFDAHWKQIRGTADTEKVSKEHWKQTKSTTSCYYNGQGELFLTCCACLSMASACLPSSSKRRCVCELCRLMLLVSTSRATPPSLDLTVRTLRPSGSLQRSRSQTLPRLASSNGKPNQTIVCSQKLKLGMRPPLKPRTYKSGTRPGQYCFHCQLLLIWPQVPTVASLVARRASGQNFTSGSLLFDGRQEAALDFSAHDSQPLLQYCTTRPHPDI